MELLPFDCKKNISSIPSSAITHPIPRMQHYFYSEDKIQAHTLREKIDCRKLTLFSLLQTILRGVASEDFAEKHTVPTSIFRHML